MRTCFRNVFFYEEREGARHLYHISMELAVGSFDLSISASRKSYYTYRVPV